MIKINAVDKAANPDSFTHSCRVLDSLLSRLLASGKQIQVWVEKVVVTRIWIVVSEEPMPDAAQRLSDLLDETWGTTGRLFSAEATHAAQSLMWKMIEAAPGAPQERTSDTWCRLARHAIFDNAGELNKSKLGRKMMLHALANGDLVTAREAFFQLPESGKSAPMTMYIMYKLALQSGDAELASTSLDGVLKVASADTTYLYACTLEAQQAGDRQQVIAALQKVLEYNNSTNDAKGIHLPVLLRSTAKMIIVEMDDDLVRNQTALNEVCKIFECAMSQTKSFRGPEITVERYQAELRWFASYSYNLTLTHMAEMRPELLVRFMAVCIFFVDKLRTEDGSDKTLLYRLLICRFLAASALVVLGRSEDDVECSLSFYLDTRRQIEAFQKCVKDALESAAPGSNERADIILKDFELLKYDLEALLKLQHWNDLDRVLEVCIMMRPTIGPEVLTRC